MSLITRDDVVAAIDRIGQVMAQRESELCEMDARMGDGDLGVTMRKGWQVASEVARSTDEPDVGKLLVTCGMKLSSAVPSTMGTLMASGLMTGGKAILGKTELNISAFADFLQGFCDGIIKRGKCQPGDRTVLDSLWPAAQEAKKYDHLNAHAMQGIRDASDAGLERTKRMLPKYGKAAVFSNKALGVVDQGAVVGNLIIHCFCDQILSKGELT